MESIRLSRTAIGDPVGILLDIFDSHQIICTKEMFAEAYT
jgi:hypothetical protein